MSSLENDVKQRIDSITFTNRSYTFGGFIVPFRIFILINRGMHGLLQNLRQLQEELQKNPQMDTLDEQVLPILLWHLLNYGRNLQWNRYWTGEHIY